MSAVVSNGSGRIPDDFSELNAGDCLAGRYRILGVLGTGGMATVYKANDLRLKRDVAIKVVLPELRRNWKTLQRFMREAQAMAALDSPRVVPVYDVGQEGDRYFMVMKLVDAPSLSEILDRGPMEEMRALSIVAGVLEGLRDLHAKGIVHRDVKPSNIVVESGDRPMLLDFGIVLEVSEPSLTQEGMLVGTPHYMAPEQIFAPTAVDGRADLYAVGVLLFEMLTAHLPYSGKTPQELMQSHIRNEIPDPTKLKPNLSRRTTAIVRRALIKDPTERYQTAEEMLAALRGVDEPVELEPTGEISGPYQPRDHFILALVGVAFLALAALVVATAISRVEEPVPQPILAEVKSRPAPPPPRTIEPAEPAEPAEAADPAEPIAEKVAPPVKAEVKPEVKAEAGPEAKAEPKRRPKPRKRPPPRRRAKVEEERFLAALPASDREVKRAQAMLKTGDTRGAIRLLSAVIQKNPDVPSPYPTLGDAYALTGNKVAAIAAYRRYLALSPHGAGAKRVEKALGRLGGR